jgi:hypothetical protein
LAAGGPDEYAGDQVQQAIAFAPFCIARWPMTGQDLIPVIMTIAAERGDNAGLPPETSRVRRLGQIARRQAQLLIARHGKLCAPDDGLFLAESGATGTHVPFNGSPPAALAVAQGEADATFMVAPALLAHVRAGKIRMLAVSSSQRPDSLKELPTLADAGFPSVESLAWNGLFTAAGTPEHVVQKINADVDAVLRDRSVRSALDAQGLTPVGAQRWTSSVRSTPTSALGHDHHQDQLKLDQ